MISHTAKIDRKKSISENVFNLGAKSGKRTGLTIWVLLLGPVNEKFESFYHMSPTAICSRLSFIVFLYFRLLSSGSYPGVVQSLLLVPASSRLATNLRIVFRGHL